MADNFYSAYKGVTGGTAGVSSVNSITGAVVLVAGSGISITPAGQNITIAATGGSDAVQGAANLTTAGAITYVTSSGTITQDSANLFYDSANARVGIGINSSLLGPLHIKYTGAAAGSGFQFLEYVNNNASGIGVAFRKSRGAGLAVQAGDGLGGLTANGADATTYSAAGTAFAGFTAQENFTTTNHGTGFLVQTTPTTGSVTRRNSFSVNAGNTRVYEAAGTGSIIFAIPTAVTSHTLTWPSAQGAASTVLTNNGSGTLSWAASSSSQWTTAGSTITYGQALFRSDASNNYRFEIDDTPNASGTQGIQTVICNTTTDNYCFSSIHEVSSNETMYYGIAGDAGATPFGTFTPYAYYQSTSGAHAMHFRTNSGAAGISIDGTGKVGVGFANTTSSFAESFNVSGNTHITGNFYIDGTYRDSGNTLVANFDLRRLYKTGGATFTVDFQNGSLYYSSGVKAYDWENGKIFDTSNNLSIWPQIRRLYANDGTTFNLIWNDPGILDFNSSLIKKPAGGSGTITALATTKNVTDARVTTGSMIVVTLVTNDATAQVKNVVPNAGSFDINVIAPTADTDFKYVIIETPS